MKTFKFDLLLSGLRNANDSELNNANNQLIQVGCDAPSLRRDKDGIRLSMQVQAKTLTQAIYVATRQVAKVDGYKLSVRSVEWPNNSLAHR